MSLTIAFRDEDAGNKANPAALHSFALTEKDIEFLGGKEFLVNLARHLFDSPVILAGGKGIEFFHITYRAAQGHSVIREGDVIKLFDEDPHETDAPTA